MQQPTVLVVAAHPDDEVLGCGGSIARHRKLGHAVSVLILADGVSSRLIGTGGAPHAHAERRECAHRANAILGVDDLVLLAYPDNRMDEVALLDIVQEVEKAVERCGPSIVYTHQAGDVNVDHCRAHDAVVVACRPQPGHCVRRLLFFETPSSTEWRPASSRRTFSPNWFGDISETLPLKLQALTAYAPELRDFPHPRSLAAVEHLARWRGASAGLAAAEAFELGRNIES